MAAIGETMDNTNAFRGLNFRVRPRRIPARVLIVGAAFLVFTLTWWVVPNGAFYWLFSPILLMLVWVASYGWRPAVARLIEFLQFLEER